MEKTKKANFCLVKSNENLRKKILETINELGLSYDRVIEDAKEKGFTIEKSQLSKYLSKPHPVTGGLTQEAIMWLATRYGIGVHLFVGNFNVTEAIIGDKKSKVIQPVKGRMSDQESLAKLKQMWK